MIFVAITDYPGGFNLSGQMKGKKGCLVCLGDTQYVYLFGSKKLVYMRSRRFLPPSHRYRKMRKEFDGTEEKGRAPKHLDGKLVFELVKNIRVVFGKKVAKGKESNKKRKKTIESDDQTKEMGCHEEDAIGFKKLSIFFKYLPYWKDLDIRHAIDVMHVEKNVCDSILGILLDIKGKTKEGLKSRKDFVDLNIRHELHPKERANGKYYIPAASYNLTIDEKKGNMQVLTWCESPDGLLIQYQESSADERFEGSRHEVARLSCDDDSDAPYCNQVYQARLRKVGSHTVVSLLQRYCT